jgi:hypothetical protein
VRLEVLQDIDGAMLLHGLQGFQGRRIHVPRADHLKPGNSRCQCATFSHQVSDKMRHLLRRPGQFSVSVLR